MVRALHVPARMGAAVRKVVRQREDQRRLQLPRSPRRAGLGDRVAFYYEGGPLKMLQSALRSRTDSCSTRSSARRTACRRSASARARRSASTWGWGLACRSRCSRCAPRRAAHRRLRRVLRRGARRPPERHALRGAAHAGRELPARDDRPAEAQRRRRASPRARRAHGRGRPAHTRRRADDVRTRHHLERARRGTAHRSGVMSLRPMDAEDLLYLLYTSGTTAKPRASRTRPPATSSASRRRTTTSST